MGTLRTGIREIKICNFRGISELALSFVGLQNEPTQVVVIGGPNGSGKTSVLEACLWASGYAGSLNGKTGGAAVRAGASSFQVEISLQADNHVFKHSYDNFPNPKPPHNHFNSTYFSSSRAPGLVGALGITAGKRGRLPDRTQHNRLSRIKQYLINSRAHDLFPAISSIERNETSRFETLMAPLNEAWNMFYPGQRFTVEPVSEDPNAGFDVFLTAAGCPRLSVDVLSSGQLEIFSFAGGLLVDIAPPGLIVIDEPELHLDPQWHRHLVRALMYLRPECQFLLATHSPEIYDSVHSFQRHFLVSPDDPRAQPWNLEPVVEQVID